MKHDNALRVAIGGAGLLALSFRGEEVFPL
jgi:hypothetical protein